MLTVEFFYLVVVKMIIIRVLWMLV